MHGVKAGSSSSVLKNIENLEQTGQAAAEASSQQSQAPREPPFPLTMRRTASASQAQRAQADLDKFMKKRHAPVLPTLPTIPEVVDLGPGMSDAFARCMEVLQMGVSVPQPLSSEERATQVQEKYATLVALEKELLDLGKTIRTEVAALHQQGPGLLPWSLAGEGLDELVNKSLQLQKLHREFMELTLQGVPEEHLDPKDVKFKKLSKEYSMPARMWRHSVQASLEIMRGQQGHPQVLAALKDFARVSFEHLKWINESVLGEARHAPENAWMQECVGDAARYVWALGPEEMKAHWNDVTYAHYRASVQNEKEEGRLFHHLALMDEKSTMPHSSLRGVGCLSKSFTALKGFAEAKITLEVFERASKEQMSNEQIDRLPRTLRRVMVEAASGNEIDLDHRLEFLQALETKIKEDPSSLRDEGAEVASALLAGMVGFGDKNDDLRRSFVGAGGQVETTAGAGLADAPAESEVQPTSLPAARQLALDGFMKVVREFNGLQESKQNFAPHDPNLLSFVHVFFNFLRSASQNEVGRQAIQGLPWSEIVPMLNSLVQAHAEVEEHFQDGMRLTPEESSLDQPKLSEDYLLQGTVWQPASSASSVPAELPRYFKSSLTPVQEDQLRRHRILGDAFQMVGHVEEIEFDPVASRFEIAGQRDKGKGVERRPPVMKSKL